MRLLPSGKLVIAVHYALTLGEPARSTNITLVGARTRLRRVQVVGLARRWASQALEQSVVVCGGRDSVAVEQTDSVSGREFGSEPKPFSVANLLCSCAVGLAGASGRQADACKRMCMLTNLKGCPPVRGPLLDGHHASTQPPCVCAAHPCTDRVTSSRWMVT